MGVTLQELFLHLAIYITVIRNGVGRNTIKSVVDGAHYTVIYLTISAQTNLTCEPGFSPKKEATVWEVANPDIANTTLGYSFLRQGITIPQRFHHVRAKGNVCEEKAIIGCNNTIQCQYNCSLKRHPLFLQYKCKKNKHEINAAGHGKRLQQILCEGDILSCGDGKRITALHATMMMGVDACGDRKARTGSTRMEITKCKKIKTKCRGGRLCPVFIDGCISKQGNLLQIEYKCAKDKTRNRVKVIIISLGLTVAILVGLIIALFIVKAWRQTPPQSMIYSSTKVECQMTRETPDVISDHVEIEELFSPTPNASHASQLTFDLSGKWGDGQQSEEGASVTIIKKKGRISCHIYDSLERLEMDGQKLSNLDQVEEEEEEGAGGTNLTVHRDPCSLPEEVPLYADTNDLTSAYSPVGSMIGENTNYDSLQNCTPDTDDAKYAETCLYMMDNETYEA